MVDFFSDIGSSVLGFVGDGIGGIIQTILYNTIYRLMYYIVVGVCWLLQLAFEMLEVFAGITTVSYKGKNDFLLNVFFSNQTVANAYWGMALLGIVCCVGFSIYAVSKKMFDAEGNNKKSMGGILTNMFKSIIIILSMSAMMVIIINTTTVLFQSINSLFISAQTEPGDDEIVFTDEQYASMARVLNTIGNYSLSPASSSRYNINSCYNEIRADMYLLTKQGVFNYTYDVFMVKEKTDDGTEEVVMKKLPSWQRSLKVIANAGDLTQDLKMDAYNESISTAITDIMSEMRRNPSFKPLKSYERLYVPTQRMRVDRLVFLMGTLRAANNAEYNVDPSLTDSVRGAYYTGTKDMYSYDAVTADFDIGIGGYDYLIVVFAALALVWSFINMIFTFMKRIFYMLMLYLVAPPAIATIPMDDGDKFNQWTQAFVVQCLSIFGTLITLHLFLVFIPIIFSNDLILFPDNVILNLVGKLLLLVGGAWACRDGNTIITGIITGSGGTSSSVAANSNGMASAGEGMAQSGAMFAGRTAAKGVKYGAMGVGYGAMGLGMGVAATYRGAKAIRSYVKNEMPQKMQRFYKGAGREWEGIKQTGRDIKNQFTGGGSKGGNVSTPPMQDRANIGQNQGPAQAQGQGDVSLPRQNQVQDQGNVNIPGQNQAQGQGNVSLPGQNQVQGQGNVSLPGQNQVQSQGNVNIPGQNQAQGQGNVSLPGQNQVQGQGNVNIPGQSQASNNAGNVAQGFSADSLSVGSGGGFSVNNAPQNKPIPPQAFRQK